MIVVSMGDEPVTVGLAAPFHDVQLTLRRLTPLSFARASKAAIELLGQPADLYRRARDAGLIAEDQLERFLDEGASASLEHAAHRQGLALWAGSVELGVQAIESWSGVVDEAGRPLPVSREAIGVLMASEGISDLVVAAIDQARKVIVGGPGGSMGEI